MIFLLQCTAMDLSMEAKLFCALLNLQGKVNNEKFAPQPQPVEPQPVEPQPNVFIVFIS